MKIKCLLGKKIIPCVHVPDVECACYICGWQKEEAERRKKLPLNEGENGLRRKYVGVEKE